MLAMLLADANTPATIAGAFLIIIGIGLLFAGIVEFCKGVDRLDHKRENGWKKFYLGVSIFLAGTMLITLGSIILHTRHYG